MNIHYAGTGLVRAQHYFVELRLPIFRLSHRISWYHAEISGLLQRFNGLWGGLLIEGVVVDGLAHHLQILFQSSLARANDRAVVAPRRNSDQNKDDCNYNHQLDQRKAKASHATRSALRTSICLHLLAYFQFTHTRKSPIGIFCAVL